MLSDAEIHAVFQSLLGRKADPAALRVYAKFKTVDQLIDKVSSSQECKKKLSKLIVNTLHAELNQPFIQQTDTYYQLLNKSQYSHQDILNFLQENHQPFSYLDYHQHRFYELFSLLDSIKTIHPASRSLKILEISTIPYTTKNYKKLLEGCQLYTIDRPAALGGPTEKTVLNHGSDQHFEVDLNCVDFAELAETIKTEIGRVDLIIASEVIEHITRAPKHIIQFMLQVLKPETGTALITTPNFLSKRRLANVLQGISPCAKFDNFCNNERGHHHYREYTITELSDAITSVAGQLIYGAFSSALEQQYDDNLSPQDYPFRTNLVALICAQKNHFLFQ